MSELKVVGLVNQGQYCYINSIIQCILNLDSFINNLVSRNGIYTTIKNNLESGKIKNDSILMVDLLKIINYCKKDNKSLNIKFFYKKLFKVSNLFVDNEQNDSYEFLDFLFNKLNDELSYKASVTISGNPIFTCLSNIDKYLEDASINDDVKEMYLEKRKDIEKNNNNFYTVYKSYVRWKNNLKIKGEVTNSLIIDTFFGQLYSVIECSECNNISENFDMFDIISLPLCIEFGKLETCFDKFICVEKLDLGNLWECEKCKKKVVANKQLSLWKLPMVLIIHLKRFENDKITIKKDKRPIDINISELNLEKWVHPINKNMMKNQNYKYQLQSCCCHIGEYTRGHYFSVLHKDDKWYIANDEQVKEINLGKASEYINKYCYLLFYNKK
jgi:ubiquitin C-terminal hydrolase